MNRAEREVSQSKMNMLPGFDKLEEKIELEERSAPSYLPLSPSHLQISESRDPVVLDEDEKLSLLQASLKSYLGQAVDKEIADRVSTARKESENIEIRPFMQSLINWTDDFRKSHLIEDKKNIFKMIEPEIVKREWEGSEMDRFAGNVIEANIQEIDDILNGVNSFPVGIFTDPNNKAFSHRSITNQLMLGRERLVLTTRRDYLVKIPGGKIVIINNKFGERVEPSSSQILLYCLTANADFQELDAGGYKNPKFLVSGKQNVSNVNFYFRNLVVEGNYSHFSYELYSPMEILTSTKAMYDIHNFLQNYRLNYSKISHLRKRSQNMFDMPKI